MNINYNAGQLTGSHINGSQINNGNQTGNINISANQNPQINSANQAVSNAYEILRNLSNGETISGTISDMNGASVTITLENGQSFSANLLNNAAYNIGDKASFIIQDNKGESILLKSIDAPASNIDFTIIDKSLEFAGLGTTDANRSMVTEMMRNNMSVSRDALLDVAKTIANNTQADIRDVITLTRMGIEVNDSNLTAYNNYKDYNGAVMQDIDNLSAGLAKIVDSADTFHEVVNILKGESFNSADNTSLIANNMDKANGSESEVLLNSKLSSVYEFVEDIKTELSDKGSLANDTLKFLDSLKDELKSGTVDIKDAAGKLSGELKSLFDTVTNKNISNVDFTKNDLTDKNLELEHAIKNLFSKDSVKKLIADFTRDSFALEYNKLKDKESVKEAIAKNLNKLDELTNMSKNHGFTSPELDSSVSNIKSNIEFMNSLNQFVATAQIPLKNIGEQGEGELYVYRRNKNGSDEDDTLKAFLHLDMEHLGPMDVYVTVKDRSVATNFIVEDDAILDFLEANMDLLTKALMDDGYSVKTNVALGKDNKGFDFVEDVVAPNLPVHEIKRYKFDMKA